MEQVRRRFSDSEKLREANAKMAAYHDARLAMKRGQLKSKNPSSRQSSAGNIQLAIAGVFVVAFLATPFVGKKIAQDEAFRNKYIPSWYDFTVQKPDKPWTRDELHEQMLQVQKEVRERAIRGDFAPDKLNAMQASLDRLDKQSHGETRGVPYGWDSIHPGAGSDGESGMHEG